VQVRTRPLRADAQRNRERILRAAHAAFAEEGSAIQIDSVAHRAGVGIGTVYRHFPDKEALLVELAAFRFLGCLQEAELAAGEPDAWGAIERFVRGVAHERLLDAGLRDTLATLSPGRCHAPAERDKLVHCLDGIVARAHVEGTVRRDLTGRDLLALISGLGTAINQGAEPAMLTDVLLAGLRAG